MKPNLFLAFILMVGLSFLCGCASTPKSDLSALQGTWRGHEVGGPPGECRMTVAGDALRFQGAQPGEWYTARLLMKPSSNPKQVDVLIEDCPLAQYIKQLARGIYKLEGNTLVIAANEPGDESRPSGFERDAASRARVFVFNRQ